MKMQVTFSLNLDNGEADITKISEAKLLDLMYESPLLAADVLKDIAGISSRLYGQARDLMWRENSAGINAD